LKWRWRDRERERWNGSETMIVEHECAKRSIANSCVGQLGHGGFITKKRFQVKCSSHEVTRKVNENQKCWPQPGWLLKC
jgi:hypothetical protein